VDFLFTLIEPFSLGVTAYALRVNSDWQSAFFKVVGQFRANFHTVGSIPANHYCTDR